MVEAGESAPGKKSPMKHLSSLIVCTSFLVLFGCVAPEPAAAESTFTARPAGFPPARLWRPRSHLVGTLLVDHDGELWMVSEGGRRDYVSGDDLLGEISLDDSDAILMTAEEERCLPISGADWSPEILNVEPLWGYGDDENLYVLDWSAYERHLTTPEALLSWGRDAEWIDWFQGRPERWEMFRTVDPPFGFRDGTLVRTELGLYYVGRGRSYPFVPSSLAEEAGYDPDEALEMRDARLRDLAPTAFGLTRASFEHCPVEMGL